MNRTFLKKIFGSMFALTVSTASFAAGSGTALTMQGWRWWDIRNNLDQVKAAGYSAILLSPHTATCGGPFGGQGFDPSDFTSFDGGFGNTWELQELIRVAHSKGLQVYANMIMNHMCTHGDYKYARFGWNDFHHYGRIENWHDQWSLENQDMFGLNDLAQESAYVRGQLWNYLVKTNNMGFDGFRWDGVKHVPRWYWAEHVTNNVRSWGKFNFGEVYDANLDLLQSYVDAGMAVTDYNLYFKMKDAFQLGGDLASLDGAGFAMRNGGAAVTFVENHDSGPPSNRLLAYAFLAGYPGYPFFANQNIYDKTMNNLVWIHANKASGPYVNRWKERDVLVFEREGNLLVGINQSNAWQTRWVDSSWSSTKLHDYSGHVGDVWTAGDRRVQVSIPPMSYVMLAP